MPVLSSILKTIGGLFKVLADNFGQILVGMKLGTEREQRKQAEAEAEILRKQRDIANEPDVDDPLQAMRDHGGADEKDK